MNDGRSTRAPILYIPHGGGPLPLLGDPGHAELVDFLRRLGALLPRPRAILAISAHWEEEIPTVQSGERPALYYDYYGFPAESYAIQYAAPGSPEIAGRVASLLRDRHIAVGFDEKRGFDHGLFVPLKLIYPEANIPCLQLSLVQSLEPGEHIGMGEALSAIRSEGVLILGSGSSFHNMEAFRNPGTENGQEMSAAFDKWLARTCCELPTEEAAERLKNWRAGPHALFAHPREEHLLPLHVCFGAAAESGQKANRVFGGKLMGYAVSAFWWH